MRKIKYIYIAILVIFCFSGCSMPNQSSSDNNLPIDDFKNSVSYMAGDKYCRTASVTDYIEFEIGEVPKENGKFLYNKKEKLDIVKVKRGEKLNIDFLPKEGWTLVIKSSMPGSVWRAWYAPKNEYNINEYQNYLFEQQVMIFDETLRDEVQGIEWTKGSKQFAYCEDNTYISYNFKNADLCLSYIREYYNGRKIAKISKDNPFAIEMP